MMDWDKLRWCVKCPDLGFNHVGPCGAPESTIWFVGQSPGVQEIVALEPFVGPSGQLVMQLLERIGLSRSEVYLTNAIKCRPTGDKGGGDRAPTPDERKMCKATWLNDEMESHSPLLIVLLGKVAHAACLPGIVRFNEGQESHWNGQTFLSLYHPSWYLRLGNLLNFLRFSEKIKQILHRDLINCIECGEIILDSVIKEYANSMMFCESCADKNFTT